MNNPSKKELELTSKIETSRSAIVFYNKLALAMSDPLKITPVTEQAYTIH